jgi:hypothetical protein
LFVTLKFQIWRFYLPPSFHTLKDILMLKPPSPAAISSYFSADAAQRHLEHS